MMGWYGGYGGMGWAGWLLNGVVLVALWAVLVGAVVLGLRAWRGEGDTRTRDDEPQRLLAERFTRGEIDAEEYMRRREVLRSGR